jgi:hypothetical protein
MLIIQTYRDSSRLRTLVQTVLWPPERASAKIHGDARVLEHNLYRAGAAFFCDNPGVFAAWDIQLVKRRAGKLLLLFEACCYLVLAKVAVLLLPFRSLTERISAPLESVGREPAHRTGAICAMVARAANTPVTWAVCLPQALAGHWMLRRRGIASTVCFGVKRDSERKLAAHAWLRASGRIVLGGSIAEFTPITEFSPPGQLAANREDR